MLSAFGLVTLTSTDSPARAMAGLIPSFTGTVPPARVVIEVETLHPAMNSPVPVSPVKKQARSSLM